MEDKTVWTEVVIPIISCIIFIYMLGSFVAFIIGTIDRDCQTNKARYVYYFPAYKVACWLKQPVSEDKNE